MVVSLVLDYLHASDNLKRKKDSKPSRTRMMTHIKALRWIALKLDLPVMSALQSTHLSPECMRCNHLSNPRHWPQGWPTSRTHAKPGWKASWLPLNGNGSAVRVRIAKMATSVTPQKALGQSCFGHVKRSNYGD